METYWL